MSFFSRAIKGFRNTIFVLWIFSLTVSAIYVRKGLEPLFPNDVSWKAENLRYYVTDTFDKDSNLYLEVESCLKNLDLNTPISIQINNCFPKDSDKAMFAMLSVSMPPAGEYYSNFRSLLTNLNQSIEKKNTSKQLFFLPATGDWRIFYSYSYITYNICQRGIPFTFVVPSTSWLSVWEEIKSSLDVNKKTKKRGGIFEGDTGRNNFFAKKSLQRVQSRFIAAAYGISIYLDAHDNGTTAGAALPEFVRTKFKDLKRSLASSIGAEQLENMTLEKTKESQTDNKDE